MSKDIVIRVPKRFSDDELKAIVNEVISRLEGRVSIQELRNMLGVKEDELVEELEAYDVEPLEDKERKRNV